MRASSRSAGELMRVASTAAHAEGHAVDARKATEICTAEARKATELWALEKARHGLTPRSPYVTFIL